MSHQMRYRPRMSLISLLLLTGLVGVSVSHWRISNEKVQLKSDRQRLVRVLGGLEVDDPTKAYIRRLPTYSPLSWRFRVYLPAEYTLFCKRQLPPNVVTRIKEPFFVKMDQAGWWTIGFSLSQSQSLSYISVHVERDGGSSGNRFPSLDYDLAKHFSEWRDLQNSDTLSPQQELCSGSRIDLLRLFGQPSADNSEVGLLLYFEPEPPPHVFP